MHFSFCVTSVSGKIVEKLETKVFLTLSSEALFKYGDSYGKINAMDFFPPERHKMYVTKDAVIFFSLKNYYS